MTQSSWADHIETHVSAVYFAGDLALKVLKPLDTPFLDHSTVEKRRAGAAAEVELNRRMAPDVYLGTVPFVVDGDVVEEAILMRRLPSDRRLTLLLDEPDVDDHLRAVARRVATFHAALPPDDEAVEIASPRREWERWRDNLDEMTAIAAEARLPQHQLDRIRELADAYVAHREPLFHERAAAGLCRDGHGDLLADDIYCLDDGPRILDCLAFATRYRKGDVLADIAFLVMDIERLAGPEPARKLMSWYQEYGNEHHPSSLAHFYVAYRALVRAKVTAMRFQQTADEADHAIALHFLDMCTDHLERARPRLVLLGGGPGSGKTTLADAVADALGWTLLSSDELRKERAGIDPSTHRFAEPDEGLYRPEITADTYAELCAEAAELLQRGESVVLDASWSTADHRAGARATAQAAGAQMVELECRVSAAVAKERIVRRMSSAFNVSDATPEIVDHLAARHDDWPEAVGIETDGPVEASVAAALEAIATAHPG